MYLSRTCTILVKRKHDCAEALFTSTAMSYCLRTRVRRLKTAPLHPRPKQDTCGSCISSSNGLLPSSAGVGRVSALSWGGSSASERTGSFGAYEASGTCTCPRAEPRAAVSAQVSEAASVISEGPAAYIPCSRGARSPPVNGVLCSDAGIVGVVRSGCTGTTPVPGVTGGLADGPTPLLVELCELSAMLAAKAPGGRDDPLLRRAASPEPQGVPMGTTRGAGDTGGAVTTAGSWLLLRALAAEPSACMPCEGSAPVGCVAREAPPSSPYWGVSRWSKSDMVGPSGAVSGIEAAASVSAVEGAGVAPSALFCTTA